MFVGAGMRWRDGQFASCVAEKEAGGGGERKRAIAGHGGR